MIAPDHLPMLARKVRLRFDRTRAEMLLVYPEHGLRLSRSAAEILALCTGHRTVAQIVDELAARYGATPRARIERDVADLLEALLRRGLLARAVVR